MRIGRSALILAGVAAAAYIAGRTAVLSGGEPAALAQPPQQHEPQIPPEMQACIDAGTPGEAHRRLDVLVGQWNAEYTIWMAPDQPPMISRGTVTRDWVLGGRFVRESVEATSDWGTFNGTGYLGYSNIDGVYQNVWLDSMSTGVYLETATLNPQTGIFSSFATHRDPATGKLAVMRGEYNISNPNRQTYVGYLTGPDGKEFKHFEGVSTRIK